MCQLQNINVENEVLLNWIRKLTADFIHMEWE